MKNTLTNIDVDNLQANFNDEKLGLCKLEFIINDNEGQPFIEPYMVSYEDSEQQCAVIHIELLDTDIKLCNLYEVLSLMTIHHTPVKYPMRLAFSRTANDQLITDDNMPTHDYFSVEPHAINHELVGWNLESVDYDQIGNVLTFTTTDKAKPKDYLENQ